MTLSPIRAQAGMRNADRDDNLPLRGDVYGVERLEEHAKALAREERLTSKPRARRLLLTRLQENERVLYAAFHEFTGEVSRRHSIPASVEWLLDNFHVVQDQVREIRQDLTRGFYNELPELAAGPYAGYPRVYGLAVELMLHTDSHLDSQVLSRFVAAYQTIAPLTIGELWAFPIMLRIGLVENLRRLMSQSMEGLKARRRADAWADRLLLLSNRPASELLVVLAELSQSSQPEAEYVVQLMQRLRDQDPAVAPAIQWLETLMAQANADIETYLRELNHRRAIDHVSAGNVITSMRLLSILDWQPFVEGLSLSDSLLERDPAGAYAHMDFATRDRYRHAVEKLSKQAHVPEMEVARRAVELATRESPDNFRQTHVGYYLIDRGLAELQARVGYHPTLQDRVTAWIVAHAVLVYLGLIGLLTLSFEIGALLYSRQFNHAPGQLVLTVLLLLLPASVLAVGMVNWTVRVEIPPNPPPKLEFKAGLGPEQRTIVVVPSLLGSAAGVEYLLEHMERRYLANRDPYLHFALLCDLSDAPAARMPEDDTLLETARRGIQALNEKYGEGQADRFYLFARERRWNPVAQIWMGWERKRGNLIELNRLLRGVTDTSFGSVVGDRARLPQMKYVITLDADTELPLNSARRLVGAMAHPLNRPVVDPRTRRVVEGYGIIQPRVDVTAQAAAQTIFSRILTGEAGLDPYSSAVSDVYQDLFHTGVYIGKAIYDVDATRAALEERFPENLLLSHDLLEGTFARVGLASDIVLLEDFPSGYDAYSQRQQRWTRGDWQITDWLLPRVPDARGRRVPNPLPTIERWKIFDNLRRSLAAPAVILLLAAGWTILPGSPLVWTIIGLIALLFPLLRQGLSAIGEHPQGEPWLDYFVVLRHVWLVSAQRALLVLTLSLFQARENLEAISLAITRRLMNPRRLLEWVSAAEGERGQVRTLGDYIRRMWIAPALGVILAGLVVWTTPQSIVLAAPILGLWLVSPWVAYRISQPLDGQPRDLPLQAKEELTEFARRTWRFYDEFAGADDHWLPPDNYQVEPRRVVAHRTSPTNIGFLLLSILAAFDFRFITGDELVVRLDRVLTTLEGMERYRGHWFNWYDTLTLEPLDPPYVSTVDSGNLAACLIVVKQACLELAESEPGSTLRLCELAACADEMARAIDFRFLFNAEREIFVTGFNVAANRGDGSYYDLLASEARLTSLIAIALGQVPDRHWFRLGRPLTRTGGRVALLSWGGTMFEYLLPTLFTHAFPYTLLRESYAAAITRQIEYAKEHHVPWGISESGYAAFDFQFNYQYRIFGVPDLSLRREVGENLVVAPYATFLALPFVPEQAWHNLRTLQQAGGADGYGFYEALDYTPTRRPPGKEVALVREFMAHHQGMNLVALDNFLNGYPMRRRFHREPALGSVELLLQERVPQHTPVLQPPSEERPTPRRVLAAAAPDTRLYETPHTPMPRAHLLSNGEYTVMVTNAGGGYSAYKDLDVTRWRQDGIRDPWGTFIYVRDLARDEVWSAAYQPTRREPEEYRAAYTPNGVEFWRRDRDIETKTEIVVSPEDNVEVRRITLTNRSLRSRLLELTSYAEVVLDGHRADAAHPAFGKLFVESEYVGDHKLLLFKRRPHAKDQVPVWAFHLLGESEAPGATLEHETDRARFIGRGRTAASPAALAGRLSNTTGAVLDPIMSLRVRMRLKPGESKRLAFITGVTESREQALILGGKYTDARHVERAFDLARVHSRIVLQHLNISPRDGQSFQRLASRLLYPEAEFMAAADDARRNVKGSSGLWPYGISGDYPIVLVRVDSAEQLSLVRQMLLAHEYWRLHNLHADLVILDGSPTTYQDGLRGAIEGLVNTSLSHQWVDKPGGIFMRRADHMPAEDRVLLQTAARVILKGDRGDLEQQLKLTPSLKNQIITRKPAPRPPTSPARRLSAPPRDTQTAPRVFDNGLGGFSADGREYVITLSQDPLREKEAQWTPAPWTNIIANDEFGALVTELGLGYAWSINSQQNRLTPWSNDPVGDPAGQIIYLRDEATQGLWTPTPLPLREREPYFVRHGAGYTSFEHTSHDLAQSLLVFVPRSDPVQLMRLKLANLADRARRITVTFYAEWVLGVTPEQARHFVITEYDAETRAVLARNAFNAEFNRRVAFAATDGVLRAFTTDRGEFLGRNGASDQPAALLNRGKLSGSAGGRIDPCAALETSVELAAGEEKETLFLLGQGSDLSEARQFIDKYRDPKRVQAAFDETHEFWDNLLGAVQVKTPDAELDMMLNRWLLYQVLACRVWGRTAFYQSGGAWGFRDQLQDVMALVYTAPQIAREHILRAAARQFVQGDVQHWWHPPEGKGVRTHISDDPLWLPFVAEHYVTTTGDLEILNEEIPFLQAPLLGPEEREAYGQPEITAEKASLYEHCLRALDHGLSLGEHGLPLIGTGDWNDGMNAVGEKGKGESVWLGWFLYANLDRFARLCEGRGDRDHAQKYSEHAADLARALEEHGWDGAWYRRAYFDDGSPLGSAQNAEGRIDAIAQAWSIIADAAAAERRSAALKAVEEHLFRERDQLMLLLTPPYDHSSPSPGYIQGYVPGIRENGGEYTHGALWVVLAYALEGDGDRAFELLQMLNPIRRARSPAQVARYKVEPYVVAADVYSHPAHIGRGGWSWYTGAAGWMYRIGLESILGFKLRGDVFSLEPCIPHAWPKYQLSYRDGDTRYEITVENPQGVNRGVRAVELDGVKQDGNQIARARDGKLHSVRVVMG